VTCEEMVALLSKDHPENPVLNGCVYPHVTAWRCSVCLQSYRIAGAKEREWCMVCTEPLRLLTPPGNHPVAVGAMS
jgi:hypothetical protein